MTSSGTTKETAQDTTKTEDKESGEDEPQPRRLEWRDVGAVVSIFALFGIFLSGIAFTYAVAFYEKFGLTVRDVGYSQQEPLAYAAVWSAVFGLVGLILVVAFSKTFRSNRPRKPLALWVKRLLAALSEVTGLRCCRSIFASKSGIALRSGRRVARR